MFIYFICYLSFACLVVEFISRLMSHVDKAYYFFMCLTAMIGYTSGLGKLLKSALAAGHLAGHFFWKDNFLNSCLTSFTA